MTQQQFLIRLDWYRERVWTRKLIQRGWWIDGKKVLPWGRPNPQLVTDDGVWFCNRFEMSFKSVDTKIRKR